MDKNTLMQKYKDLEEKIILEEEQNIYQQEYDLLFNQKRKILQRMRELRRKYDCK